MRRARPLARALAGASALWLGATATPAAQPDAAAGLPAESAHVGRAVPDIAFASASGASSLSRWAGEQPLLLALVFTRCAGLCSPFLASLEDAEAAAGARGAAVQTLVLSIDPRDSVADMAELARRLGLERAADWAFGVAAPADVRALADAVGFWFEWDAGRQQFDHPGLLVGIRAGRVVRLLVGPQVEAVRLSEVVRELRGEFVAAYPLPGRVLFRCFQYDPRRGRFRLDWGFLVLLAPALCAFAGTLALFRAGERSRRAGGPRSG